MTWAKQNKFLAGFIGVVVVAAAILIFLLLKAKGAYNETYATYEQEVAELNRMEGLQPYPNAENVKKLEAQRDEYLAQTGELLAAASAKEIPLTEMSATAFQDRLRAVVNEVTERANAKGVKMPGDRFSLGFERYLTDLPRPEAAAPLARQLEAIKLAMDAVIDSQVSTVENFARPELPQERGAVAGEEPPKGGRPTKTAEPLVEKHAFSMTLGGRQPQIRNALNKIVSSDKQFYIPRVISVTNEQLEGPPRQPAGMEAFGAPPAPGSPAAPSGPRYIVGEESIKMDLLLEIADFAEPETPKTSARK